MIKILIVDDEEYIRDGIELKIERYIPDVRIIGKAGDAHQALEAVKDHHPDIIITDIRMPETDGLSFIEAVKKMYEDIKFIIISGYQDFNYAKKAITLGVEDYLLKPVKNQELIDIIGKIKNKLTSDEYTRKHFLELKSSQRSNIEFVRNKHLTEIVENTGEFDIEETLKTLERIGISFCNANYTVVSLIFNNQEKTQASIIDNLSLLKFALINISEELLSPLGRAVAFENVKKENQIIAIVCHSKENKSRIPQLCKELLAACNKHLGLNLTIGIGGVCGSLKELNKSYTESLTAASQRIVLNNKNIIQISEVPNSSLISYFLTESDRHLLASHINSNNLEEAFSLIDSIFITLKAKDVSYLNVKALCIDILIQTTKIVKEYGSEWENIFNKDILSDTYLSTFSTLDDLKQFVKDYIKSICSYLANSRKSSGKKAIDEIKEYINKNYHTDINLNDIAGRYYINPNYLSQLFKIETGQKFIDYITKTRIEKAKELLAGTFLKSYEIAEMVGYIDSKYFCNVFSKLVGMSPAKYREQVTQKIQE